MKQINDLKEMYDDIPQNSTIGDIYLPNENINPHINTDTNYNSNSTNDISLYDVLYACIEAEKEGI
ncbi:MAG: hypothetical protein LBM93_09455 [Oscillospiraceae bacterium]|jgi:hypothetical protein|nr:hypothetical protein [Oscillospiraceae bacterium]